MSQPQYTNSGSGFCKKGAALKNPMKYLFSTILFVLALAAAGEVQSDSTVPDPQDNTWKENITVDSWAVSFENAALKESLPSETVWKDGAIPRTFKLKHPTPAMVKYIWLKGRFTIDNNPENYYGISLGRIYHSDMVFINNFQVGNKSLKDFFELHYPRNYSVNPGIFRKGINEVLIRVGIFSDQFGGLANRVRVLDRQAFEEKLAQDNFLFFLLPFGILTLYMGFAVLLYLLFYYTRIERKLIYCSIGLSFFILLILILFFPYQSPLFTVPLEIQLSIQITVLKILIPMFLIVLIFIIQSLYRTRLVRYNRIAVAGISTILALIMINTVIFSNPLRTAFTLTLLVLVIISGIPYLGFMTHKLNSLQPDKFKVRMIAAMLVLAGLTIIWEGGLVWDRRVLIRYFLPYLYHLR
jgi:hypothetical protein